MPAPGLIGVSLPQQLFAGLPNPSIWGDCPGQELNDSGRGYYAQRNFIDASIGTLGSTVGSTPGLPYDADTSTTFAYDATYPHTLDVTLPATSGKGFALLFNAMGAIAAGSGRKMWAEVNFAVPLNSTTIGNAGVLFGFADQSALASTSARVAISSVSTTTVLTPASNSFIGFGSRQAASAIVDFDALYTSGTGGVINSVATKVLNSNAFNQYNGQGVNQGGNWFPGGILNYPSAPGNAVANTFYSLGLRYDGQQYIYFYVNGVVVAKQIVDSTVDQSSNYGVIFNVLANTATAYTTKLSFFRAAYQYIG